MSLDYPDYEKIKKQKKHFLAFIWMIGDRLYYVGLLGMVGIVAFVLAYLPLECLFSFLRHSRLPKYVTPRLPMVISLTFGICFLFSFISLYIKNFACKTANIARNEE